MLAGGALLVGLAAILGVLVGLCSITAVRKLSRGIADRRVRDADARVRPVLIRLLGDPDSAPPALPHRSEDARAVERLSTELLAKVRGEAREALSGLLRERGAIEHARRQIRRRSAVGRARAVELLGAAGIAEAVPDLLRLLEHDRDRAVRIVSARALGRIGDAVAVAPLLASLGRGLPAGAVAHAILQVGPAAEPALRTELAGGSEAGRGVAAELLGLLGSIASIADLARALGDDTDPRVRARAATAIGRIGAPSGIDALAAALCADRTTPERAAAAEALGRMSATVVVPVLVGLVDESVVPVARAAAGALADLGSDGRRELETLAVRGGVVAVHAREALGSGR
jgi:HEAT repeat protein